MPEPKKKPVTKKGDTHQPIKRHRLTEEEKATVLKLYEEYGSDCWDKVQQALHLKSKRTAREHFYKFLITDSKKPFTEEEDQLIVQKVKELGTKWSQIAKFFENRSDINIRNRYRILSRNIDPSKSSKKKQNKSVPTQKDEIKVPIIKSPAPEASLGSSIMLPNGTPVNLAVISPEDLTSQYIILDFHHFDLITMKDMNFSTPDDFFSPMCFKI